VAAMGRKKKNNNLPVQCLLHTLRKNKEQSTCARNKRKKWLLLGGDPCPNTTSLAAAAIKKERANNL